MKILVVFASNLDLLYIKHAEHRTTKLHRIVCLRSSFNIYIYIYIYIFKQMPTVNVLLKIYVKTHNLFESTKI